MAVGPSRKSVSLVLLLIISYISVKSQFSSVGKKTPIHFMSFRLVSFQCNQSHFQLDVNCIV